MSHRNTDIGGDLNIVKDRIRYYREKNNYSYQQLSDLLMLHGIDIHKQEILFIFSHHSHLKNYNYRFLYNMKLVFLGLHFVYFSLY